MQVPVREKRRKFFCLSAIFQNFYTHVQKKDIFPGTICEFPALPAALSRATIIAITKYCESKCPGKRAVPRTDGFMTTGPKTGRGSLSGEARATRVPKVQSGTFRQSLRQKDRVDAHAGHACVSYVFCGQRASVRFLFFSADFAEKQKYKKKEKHLWKRS